jgi:hypothetical protein
MTQRRLEDDELAGVAELKAILTSCTESGDQGQESAAAEPEPQGM